jgi:hypothetical protein
MTTPIRPNSPETDYSALTVHHDNGNAAANQTAATQGRTSSPGFNSTHHHDLIRFTGNEATTNLRGPSYAATSGNNALVAHSNPEVIVPAFANHQPQEMITDLLWDEAPAQAANDTIVAPSNALDEKAQLAEAIRLSLAMADNTTDLVEYEPETAMVPFTDSPYTTTDIVPASTDIVPVETQITTSETAMVPYTPAAEPAMELPAYTDTRQGLADSDYVDEEADIDAIAAQTLEVDNTRNQTIDELRPQGKLSRFQQRTQARLASLNTAYTDTQNYNKKLIKYNGTTKESTERALQATNQGLRYEFEDLFENMADLNRYIKGYKNIVNKKVDLTKVASFGERFESIAAEAARLNATVNHGNFLDEHTTESSMEDTFKFLDTNPLRKLETKLNELREVYDHVANMGSRNIQTLEQDLDWVQPKGFEDEDGFGHDVI